MHYSYSFPAVKGTQANSEYYICMIPCGLLSKIFIVDSAEILPEFRAQRKINYTRIPEMKKYILSNRNSYVFSALAASIDGNFKFKDLNEYGVGILEVDMNSKFLINDGQHRKTAIEEAIIEDPTLASETIPVVFFKDKGLVRSQQMFTDLNKHAVNTSKSLNALYDSTDQIAVMTKETVRKIRFFKKYTELEKDILGKYSKNLFTLNNFYNANIKLLNGKEITDSIKSFVLNFWTSISINIKEWKEMESKNITKKDLRSDYIVTQGVVLLAFGKLGNYFLNNPDLDYNHILEGLNNINWMRTNDEWNNRTIINGKISRKEENITSTYIHIKELLGLELSEKEKQIDKKVRNYTR